MGGFGNLSSMLGGGGGQSASTFQPQDSTAFQNALYSRKDPRRKTQMLGDIYSAEGINALQTGGQLLNKPIDYFSKLLSGNRQSMLEAVAPEVNTVMGQYDTAKRAASQFSPRGGGRVSQLENLPYQEQGDITKLLQTVRPEAASALTQISGMLQSLGIQEEQMGSSNLKFASQEKDLQEQQRYQHGWDLAKFITSLFIPSGGGAQGNFPTFPGSS